MGNNDDLKCNGCGTEFSEKYITFQCENCDAHYCYDCFCDDHFEKHSTWEICIVTENGEYKKLLSEKEVLKSLNLEKEPLLTVIKKIFYK